MILMIYTYHQFGSMLYNLRAFSLAVSSSKWTLLNVQAGLDPVNFKVWPLLLGRPGPGFI